MFPKGKVLRLRLRQLQKQRKVLRGAARSDRADSPTESDGLHDEGVARPGRARLDLRFRYADVVDRLRELSRGAAEHAAVEAADGRSYRPGDQDSDVCCE